MTRSVLITGAAKRIGRALALELAADGWAVAVHYRNSDGEAEELVAQISGNGGTACAIRADLADPQTPRQLIAQSRERLGGLTCLINNASMFEYDDVEAMTAQSWAEHMSVNLRAPVFLAQAFADALGPDHGGSIINVLDQRVWKLTPAHFSYTISKSALWTATRTMAQAYAPRIRVNAVGPGPTLPNNRQSRDDFERENGTMLLERGTTPQEIAAAVKFILASPSITGQMIALDGGQHLLWQTPDMLDHPDLPTKA